MILVTGATGYIGSHTVVELISHGYSVVALDDLSTSRASTIDAIESITGVKVPFEKIDLKDKAALLKIVGKYPIDGVIHFAAHMAVGESVLNPLKYYENNLCGLLNLFHFMDQSGCKNLIFSSSCTVYGEVNKVPVTEDFPTQRPPSPYGNTKKIAEEIIEDLAATNKLKSICLRYFNPIGAHPSGLLGENPDNMNNLMPLLLKVASGKMESLKVFGNDYKTRDGSCVRDYIHVMDLATAHVKAYQRLAAKESAVAVEKFNLGSGNGFTVLEMIHAFEKVNGIKINYKIEDRRPGDAAEIFSDSKLAAEKLKWKTERSLEDMLSSAWNREKTYRQNELR
ncbi:MAG: UDP-glucose 4-epimerase GalE [Bacteroidetes bacterium]|nr:UDP-glucose 4-epimerase GalE [Bacteroidota bacterium]